MLKVVGIFGSEVFCACVYGYVVTDVLSGVEGDRNVNRERVLLIRPLLLLLEELACGDVREEDYVSDSGRGGGS